MGNRFGITTGNNAGDGNTPNGTDATENTETTSTAFTGISFNSVVNSSFNNALVSADQLRAQEKVVQQPDNSNAFSMGANFVTGVGGGLLDQAGGFFKKDRAQLAREADLGGISALHSGNTVSAAFTKTAGDLAKAAPALNPLSQQGRQNWGLLADKWADGWTGTWDQKMKFAGTNASYLLTIGGGGASSVRSGVNVANDLRVGTLATRTAAMGDNIATTAGTLGDDLARNTSRLATETTIPSLVAKPGHQFIAPVVQNPGFISRGVNYANDLRAGTLRIGENGLAAETNTIGRVTHSLIDVKPTTITSDAITAAGKAKTGVAVEDFLTRIAVKDDVALQQIKTATETMIAQGTPRAQTNFISTLRNFGTHSEDIVAQGNQFLNRLSHNSVMERFALQVNGSKTVATDIGASVKTLTDAFGKGSAQAKALKEIDVLAQNVAGGLNKSDDLIRAVETFRRQTPNLSADMVKVLDNLAVDASRLEATVSSRSLTVAFENSVKSLSDDVTKFNGTISAERVKYAVGTGERTAINEIGNLADELARGVSSPEKLSKAIDDLARMPGVKPETVRALIDDIAPVVERANVTRMLSHVDEMVKPVRQITGELDNVIAGLRIAKPEQAAQIQKAMTEFISGRAGNADEVTAAFKAAARGEVDDALRAVSRTNPEHAARMQQVIAEFTAKGGGKADDLAHALKNVVDDPAMAGQIDDLVKAVGKEQTVNAQVARLVESVNAARPMMTLEKSFAESMNILEDATARFAQDATKLKAVNEVKQAFNAALHGTASADDVAQAIARNRNVLGTSATEKLTVNAAKIGDAAIDTTRSVALTEAGKTSARITETVQALRTTIAGGSDDVARNAARPLDEIEASVAAFGNRSISAEQLSNNLKSAVDRLKAAGVNTDEVVKHVDELTAVAPRVERLAQIEANLLKARQYADNITSTTNAMESVVRQGGQFKAVDDLRNALRNGTAQQVDDAIAAASREFPDQARILNKIKADAVRVTEAGSQSASMRSLSNSIDDLERIAKQSSDEFKALEQIRAAAARVSRDGVGDDLARVIQSNKQQIAAIEARMAGTEGKNLVAKLTDDARDLGGSATAMRSLNNVEQSTRALANVIDSVAPKLADDVARQQLNTIKNLSDDLVRTYGDDAARTAAKQQELQAALRNSTSHLDEVAPGAVAKIESRIKAVDDAAQMVAAERAIAALKAPRNLADDAVRLGFEADTPVHKLAQEFNTQLRNFADNGGNIKELNAAAAKLTDFTTDVAAQRANLKALQDEVAKANQMANTVAAAQQNQLQAFANAVNSRSVNSYNNALNHLANLHQIAPSGMKDRVMSLRDTVLDARASRAVSEQFGGRMIAPITHANEFKEVAGLVSNKAEFLREAQRFNAAAFDPSSKFHVRGLVQDRFARLREPSLAEEALNNKLYKDAALLAGSLGVTYMGVRSLRINAQDALHEEFMAPYEIAELMEQELSATNAVEQRDIHDRLAKRIADYIEGKDQQEIDALREKLKEIIAERTRENAQAQAVWSRSQEKLSIGEIRKLKEHDNQVQYGNPLGPTRGPGAVAAQEVVQTLFVPQAQRVRGTANNTGIDETANKRKPATTSFDIGKIKDMSASMAYNQSGLRATPYGTSGQNVMAAYTPGSTKPWQNVVSWNSGRKYGSEQGGQGVYGNFKQIENAPENDRAGSGNAAAAIGSGANDPNAALQLASQQQQSSQDEQQNAAAV